MNGQQSSYAIPTQVDIPPQLVTFRQPRRAFVLHNAKRKRVQALFCGTLIDIPAVFETVPDRRLPSGEMLLSHNDRDADGDLIPGTYVLEDQYVFIPELGDEIATFDARRAVCHILGLQPGSDGVAAVATSPFAINGISLLPRGSSKEQWKAAAETGMKRAFLADVERARRNMKALEESAAKRKAADMAPIAPDPREYDHDARLLEEYARLVRAEVSDEIAPHEADAMDEDLELEAIAEAMALKLAKDAAGDDEEVQMQLFRKMMQNPKLRARAQKEYRIRKRGSMPVSVDDLGKAAEEGKSVSDIEP